MKIFLQTFTDCLLLETKKIEGNCFFAFVFFYDDL